MVVPWKQRRSELTDMGKEMGQWDLAPMLDSTPDPSASLSMGLLAPEVRWMGFTQSVNKPL